MTLKRVYSIFILFTLFFVVACSTETGIFPVVDLDTTESSLVLPNPISVVADEANSQVVIANSNIDILYETASLAVVSVDATDTDAPVLTADKLIEIPNFATEIYFDGATSLFIPFREEYSEGSSSDILVKYTLGDGTVSEAERIKISNDPFGITGDGNNIYVVSDDVLKVYDTDLDAVDSIDLTVAEDEGFDDSDATTVLGVAVDVTENRAVISNMGGRMFVVDLDSGELSRVVSGPESTGSVLIDNDVLYVLDAITETVMMFDMTALSDPSSTPASIDDSSFILGSVSVGNNPNGLAIDAANNRLYVANTDDDTISVIDTISYQELARLSLAEEDISSSYKRDCDQPFGLTLGTFNAVPYLFVACVASHDVAVVNTDTLSLVKIFPNTER